MLSTNSLAAFSASTTAVQPGRPAAVRLVREPVGPAAPAKTALPKELPSIAPPRGSLLNLSV